ncbi:MAG: nucleotide sugar dehydrogenase [Tessaracoccus sp.]|uniref:nucleotide sugar dehydrogenase n=1 Tax=Tessaracoccus sp. TaxID=1971211 RepID=UPI001EC91FBB|nr:nucleotide sugar dehydrogenase [Tessaracoccus sp.]MBK7822448.1 nucleotide sugar dehydrogenase [Tessaracoccus sp.]
MNKILTVIGQGYVGLPLAQAAAEAGWTVWGFEVSPEKVEALNSGRSHVDDVSDAEVGEMLARGYRATTDPACVAESSVVVICVPTPLADAGAPDLTAVEQSARVIGGGLKPGTLVILESTTYPGTTEEVCGPILEEESGLRMGEGFLLAFSPERVDPGRLDFGIKNTPKLVGGIDAESTAAAETFYRSFVDIVVPLKGAREAETAKLLENTFRHVNIALVNEMAKFCHELGIDIWEVIRGAATKPFGFMSFTPGPGVGGHCIPIDPNYLSYEVRKELGYPFRFVELAQEVNNSMPAYVVSRIVDQLNEQERSAKGSSVLLLGVTYKPDIADQRESPAVPLAELLLAKGCNVSFHDPYVEKWRLGTRELDRVEDLGEALENAHLVVLLQAHRAYDLEEIERAAGDLLDTRGVTRNAVRL